MDVNIKRKAFKESVFKAYDIRGLYPEELDHNTLELISWAVAEFLKSSGLKTCVLGEDIRWSSPEIAEIIREGLLSRGVDIIDIGQATTPQHFFSIAESKADGGVMVTASHNAIRFNGLKVYKELKAMSEKSGLLDIKNLIKNGIPEYNEKRGRSKNKNFSGEYIKFLLKGVLLKRKIKAVFDTGGGAVGLLLPKILKEMKDIDAETFFLEPDPSLSKRDPNPLLPEAQTKICESILKNKAEVGFLFDPDGDRVMIFDEKAEMIRGDAVLWLLARRLVHSGEAVVYDIRSSHALVEDLEAEGIKCFKSRVGHSFVKEEMRTEDAILGGELSGHFYFKEFFHSDSALMATIKILQILSSFQKPLSEIMRPYFRYVHSGEINLSTENKSAVLSALETRYTNSALDYFDGVTFRYPDFWFNVRPSNTESLLRLVLEAKNQEIFHVKKDEILSFMFSKGAKLS